MPRLRLRQLTVSPGGASALYAGLVCASLGLFLYDIPIQLTDSFDHLLNVQGASLGRVLESYFFQEGYFRPFWWAATKLMFEASDGRYYEWFRGLHIAQTCLLVGLVVALLRPRTWTDAALLPLALAVMIGLHTFYGLVREAFPVNHYQLAVIACVATALVARGAHRWWSDAAAMALFVGAALMVESGLLVAVVAVGAYAVGLRGISRRGVALVAALLVAYVVLRLVYLGSNPPGLIERSSGYGFEILSPDALVQRFAANPLPFYLYNVLATCLSVLFSEPRGGVFRFTKAVLDGQVTLPLAVNVLSSTLATATIAAYAWQRRSAWRAWALTSDDQLVLLFLAVLAGNSVMSYAYTKDVIVATAGVFYAVATFVSARHLGRWSGASGVRTWTLAVLAAITAVSWAYRAAGSYAGLRVAAYANRVEWAAPDDWLREQDIGTSRPEERALMLQLQGDALFRHPGRGRLAPSVQRLLDFD